MEPEQLGSIIQNKYPDGVVPSNVSVGLSHVSQCPCRVRGKKTRLYIDNEFFAFGYAAIFDYSITVVYCVLAKYANAKTQYCFTSVETIMREAGIKHRTTAFRAIKILEQYHIIYIEHSKGKYPNKYHLLDVHRWRPINNTVN